MPIQVESSNVPAPVVTDLDFCPWCGSILPLISGYSDIVKCLKCQFKRSVKEYESSVDEFTIHFNKKADTKAKEDVQSQETADAFAGPTVEYICPRCKHDVMTYITRQTRSADEGQTVFYTCVKCKYQHIEYS